MKVRLPPPAILDPADARHHHSFEAVERLVANGDVDLYQDRQPLGQQLKGWVKQHEGLLSPSPAQMEALALQALPELPNNAAYDAKRKDVEKWFEERRMQRFLKLEEQQAALRHESTKVCALHLPNLPYCGILPAVRCPHRSS